MVGLFKKVFNKYHYSIESIKNRYPCKIINVKNLNNFEKTSEVMYQAATKINIRASSVQEILEDPLLIEKFHPTDGVKLGFVACAEILLKQNISMEQARESYIKIINQMFQERAN